MLSKRLTVVNGIILNPDNPNQVLMGFRPPDRKKPLMWEYPGGKVEEGETLPEALKRELKEELNIDAEIGNRVAKVFFSVNEDVEIYFFAVTKFTGTPKPLVATELKWVEPEFAIDHMPCMFSVFAIYTQVISFLDSICLGRDRSGR